VISPSQERYLTHKQASMHRVEFEPTIPVFERAMTIHVLDRAVAVIDNPYFCLNTNYEVALLSSLPNQQLFLSCAAIE
jgi:hypothetical protein